MEKKCPMCAEMVNHEAKKCKHCHHMLQPNWKQWGVLAVFIFVFITVIFLDAPQMRTLSSEKSGLIVENYKISDKKDPVKILGSVKNNGQKVWNHIQVQAKFYDKNNQLVDLKTTKLLTVLRPGKSADFKIANEFKDEVLNYETVTLDVVYAYNEVY